MAVKSLFYSDVNKIISAFDEKNFGIQKPTSSKDFSDRYFEARRLVRGLRTGLPLEIVDSVIRCYCINSVGSLFMYYRTPPSLAHRATELASNKRALEGASKQLLERMNISPSKEKDELACFRQLMDLVFTSYFSSLGVNGKLALMKKIIGVDDTLTSVNNDAKFQAIQNKLLRNQSGWNYHKIQLQMVAWKVQIFIARLLKSTVFSFILTAGSIYITARAYFLLRPIAKKIADLFGEAMMKWMYWGLEKGLGKDHESKPTTVLSACYGLSLILLPMGALAGGAVFLQRSRWSFLGAAMGYILNPFECIPHIFNLSDTLSNKLADYVSRSMNQAATNAQENFIQTQLSNIKEKWYQITLSPEPAV